MPEQTGVPADGGRLVTAEMLHMATMTRMENNACLTRKLNSDCRGPGKQAFSFREPWG